MRHAIENKFNDMTKDPDYSNIEFFIDKIASKKGRKYLTVVYDITEGGEKKLLYVAKKRIAQFLDGFFDKIPQSM